MDVVIFLGIGIILGAILGGCSIQSLIRHDAIEHGVGEWYTHSKGCIHFRWKTWKKVRGKEYVIEITDL